jgi:hypothetical protein
MKSEISGLIRQIKDKIMMNENSTNHPETSSRKEKSYDTFGAAFDAGKSDGAAKARESAPEFRTGVANAAHDVAYGLGFGAVFAGAFLNELIPTNIREGLSKGARAGKDAGQKAAENATDPLSSVNEGVRDDNSPKPSFS